jgi:hypothetical protein
MPLAWLLVLNAIVVGIYGVIAILFPGPLYDLFGGRSDVGSQFVTRLAGSALLGEAILRFALRDIAPGRERNALTTAAFVEYAVAAIAAIVAQTTGVTNAAGWSIVGLLAFFALGFGYYRFLARTPRNTFAP